MCAKQISGAAAAALPRAVALAGFLFAGMAAASGQTPTPAAAPSATPSPLASPRMATNLCDRARFYSWLKSENLPTAAAIRPAIFGERLEIVSGPRYTLEAQGFYETSIPVAIGTGTGDHYWVSDKCFNPGKS